MPPSGPLFARDKAQISDALAVSQRIQALQAPPPGPQPAVQGQVQPMAYQLPAGAPNPGARFGAPPMGPQQPMAGRFGGMQAGLQGPDGGININLGPGGFQGANANVNAGDFNFSAAADNAMQLQNLQARYNPGGPFSASASYAPGQGVGGGVQYQNGPISAGAGYSPQQGAYGNVGIRQQFQEGGLATSLPSAPEAHQSAVDFINNRDEQMHEVAGKLPHYRYGGFAVR
jgi:hypothetical protein